MSMTTAMPCQLPGGPAPDPARAADVQRQGAVTLVPAGAAPPGNRAEAPLGVPPRTQRTQAVIVVTAPGGAAACPTSVSGAPASCRLCSSGRSAIADRP